MVRILETSFLWQLEHEVVKITTLSILAPARTLSILRFVLLVPDMIGSELLFRRRVMAIFSRRRVCQPGWQSCHPLKNRWTSMKCTRDNNLDADDDGQIDPNPSGQHTTTIKALRGYIKLKKTWTTSPTQDRLLLPLETVHSFWPWYDPYCTVCSPEWKICVNDGRPFSLSAFGSRCERSTKFCCHRFHFLRRGDEARMSRSWFKSNVAVAVVSLLALIMHWLRTPIWDTAAFSPGLLFGLSSSSNFVNRSIEQQPDFRAAEEASRWINW